ncbi:glycosyltransferase family 2 protein [Propionicicella superfundia]|uniref:glycosyltransferase family 2 protein n=1 Tax=Propionicicella superfundia TaxID=348582 RepID=UPI00068919E6|nr:glycosyltransferase [Propionicicella superfundia]
MPRLSVLMTAKDAAATIGEAVRSVVRALPADAELIVLDDGSRDDTAVVAGTAGDARVRVLREELNVGYARARSALLSRSDSEFVAIMDADDVCFPWRFRHQARALGSADLVTSPVVRFSTPPLRLHPGIPYPIAERAMALHLLIGCPLAHPTLMAKRSVVDALGGYREVVAEDYDLYLRAVTGGFRLARTGVPCVAYRTHARQASAQVDYPARMAADGTFQDAVDDFLRDEFGYVRPAGERGVPGRFAPWERIDAILRREVRARGLGFTQRHLLRRYRVRALP